VPGSILATASQARKARCACQLPEPPARFEQRSNGTHVVAN
jgi:hypothetical protein